MLQVIKNLVFGGRKFGNPTVLEIDTRNTVTGGTTANQFRLPLGYESQGFRFPKNTNMLVYWGDGTESFHANQSDNIIHTYSTAGIYIVQIFPEKGGYIGISHEGWATESLKILKLLHWGDAYMERNGFLGCTNLSLEFVDDTPQFFANALGYFHTTNISRINNAELWDVTALTNMTIMFRSAVNFNQDISMWNVSNVTSMDGMFRGATNFHQDISAWNFNKDVVLGLFLNAVVNYPPQYYSNLLMKFQSKFIGTGRTAIKWLNVGNNKYNASGASARAALVADGWDITDGGMI